MRGWGARLLICLGLLCAASGSARAQTTDRPIVTRQGLASADQAQLFSPDDLLLLEVAAQGHPLTEALPAYAAPAGVYLPLGELARLLELAIRVDPGRARADGWVLREDRAFHLDLAAASAEVSARRVPLSSRDAVLAQGEIYIRAELMEQLLPVRLKADVRSLALEVEATEPLPFQDRMVREARRQRLDAGRPAADPAQTFVATPYALFSPPAIDLLVSAQHDSAGLRSRYDLRAAGDLAYVGLQAFVAGEEGGRPTQARILLERKDPDRRAALVPGLSRISLGDTYTPSLPLGARAAGGRGLAFTTEDFLEIGAFDRIDLRGELETGWEVELYVDDVLRASQKAADAGQYEFTDVPLVVGPNVLRLVFYGPQGERREEQRRLHVAGGGVRQGELLIKAGVVEQGVPVLDLRPSDDPAPEGDLLDEAALDAPAPLGGARGLRAVGQIAYGLTPGAAVSAGFAHFRDLDETRVSQAVFGANASIAGFATQLNLAGDDAGGSAASLGVAGRVGRLAVAARHAEFAGGFLDEGARGYAAAVTPPRRASSVSLDSVLDIGARSLPIGVRVTREKLADGDAQLRATGRASTSVGRILVSGTVRYDHERSAGREDGRFAAGITASGLIDERWRVRATAVWDRDALATVTLDRRWGRGHALRLGLAQRWGDHGATTLQLSHVWRLRTFDVSVFGGYTSADGETRLGLQFSTGLVFDAGAYRMVGPGAAAGGAMSVHAFVDSDGDGRWRPGEAPAAGLGVEGARRPVSTDAEGRALVTGLGDGARASIRMDTSAIDDPFLAPPPARLVIVPRPGRVAVAAFPLQQTGEVEITVALLRDGEPAQPLSAVRLQLVGAGGEVAAEGRTEFDGALVVSGLRPGDYRLRVDPQQAASLGLVLQPRAPITVPPGGGFVGQVAAEVRLGPPQSLAGAADEPMAAAEPTIQRTGAAPPEPARPPVRGLRSLGRGLARLLAPLNPFRHRPATALASAAWDNLPQTAALGD